MKAAVRLRDPELLAALALVGMAAAWGSTFFLIKDLLTRLDVADLLAVRFLIAAVVLIAVAHRHLRMARTTLTRGIGLGVLFGIAQLLQTAGLGITSASTSGFVTGLYVVITPLLAAVLFRAKLAPATWVAVGLATLGLAILSLNGFAVGPGELLTLASAAAYAGHIIAMSRWATTDTALSLTLVQVIVVAVMCTVAALPGGITPPSTGFDWFGVLYLAIIAGIATMFLQTWAQARIDPTRAAVIMAGEPVWAAVFAVTLGAESITWRMLVGGASIVAAMYLVELAPRMRWGRGRRPVPEAAERGG